MHVMQMRASWTWMMSRHRFPCHLLGPDADEPVEESLARLEDSPNCQVGRLQNLKLIGISYQSALPVVCLRVKDSLVNG